MGLFGSGSRLVVFEGVEAWKPPDAKAIAAYLASPAPGTTLALVAAELRKDGPLAKAVAGRGTLLIWDVAARAVPKWIAEQFTLHGTTAEPEACRLLADLVGDDLYELASEIDKLVTWASGEAITAADVEALVAPRAESPPWDLTDAWGARDVGGVLRATERMLDRTGDPVSKTIPRLLGSLTKHVRNARAIRRLDDEGVTSQEAASRLGLKPYPAQKLYAQVRKLQRARARRRADPVGRAGPRAQGRFAARERARARARARRDHRGEELEL